MYPNILYYAQTNAHVQEVFTMSSSSYDSESSSFETGVSDEENYFLFDSGDEADLESEVSDVDIAILGLEPYSYEPYKKFEKSESQSKVMSRILIRLRWALGTQEGI